jgi:chemotaxis protein methyltransferase CheR
MPTRPAPLTDKDFRAFADFITSKLGIKMPSGKKSMLEARLNKRLRLLGLHSYSQYRELLFSEGGQKDELPHLYDAVTTNTTHFFRESNHFDALRDNILPGLHARLGGERALRVWSAGCSTGEEPYTLAMVLDAFAQKHQKFSFESPGDRSACRVRDGQDGGYSPGISKKVSAAQQGSEKASDPYCSGIAETGFVSPVEFYGTVPPGKA